MCYHIRRIAFEEVESNMVSIKLIYVFDCFYQRSRGTISHMFRPD